jgi:hypothetical protein
MKRLRVYVQALTHVLFVIGHFLLLGTIVLWYLAETGRLTIAGLEPINVGVVTLISYLAAISARLANKGETRQQRDQAQEWRNRQQLIQNVQATWIEGVRNQTLYKSVWIELGLKFEPAQVNLPWHIAWRFKDEMQLLPKETTIISIFRQQAANTLLILGAPGSGKTVTLLDLAQELLDEAEKAPNAPVPVVFNLSSWAVKRQPLQEWLLEELDRTYYVPKKVGLAWLEKDAIILLLDGLDEVAESQRQACVTAINTYRLTHGLTGMAVCSRLEEYEVLAARLDLLGAVIIQPLTAIQADSYLRKMGRDLRAVRRLLQEDESLQEWVQSPLFLYVVGVAYRGLSLEELRCIHTGNLNRLYDTYVEQVLQRHRAYQQIHYKPQQIRNWLSYLANQLVQRDLTVYLIEQMQPDWLGKQSGQQQNEKLSVMWLKKLLGEEKITIIDRRWSWATAVWGGGEDRLFNGRYESLFNGMAIGLSVGLAFGLFFGLIGGLFNEMIPTLYEGLGAGFFAGLFGGLIGGLFGGDVRKHEKPNQGIWRTLLNGLLFSLGIGLYVGLTSWFFDEPALNLFVGVYAWFSDGLIFGLAAGLFFGLGTFLKHFILRWLQAYYGYLPFRLVPFLEFVFDNNNQRH